MTQLPPLAIFLGVPGWAELLILGGIVLLLFGKRLPGAMRSLGRSVVEFKKGVKGIEDDGAAAGEKTTEAPQNKDA